MIGQLLSLAQGLLRNTVGRRQVKRRQDLSQMSGDSQTGVSLCAAHL